MRMIFRNPLRFFLFFCIIPFLTLNCYTDTGRDRSSSERDGYLAVAALEGDDQDIVENVYSGINDEYRIETPEEHGMSTTLLEKAAKAVVWIGGRCRTVAE